VAILVIEVIDMDLNQVVDAIKTNYQLIGGVVGLLALVVYFIKFSRKISNLEASKETYDAKIEALKEKYETSEKIKKIELDVEKLSAEVKAEKEYVREHIFNTINLIGDESTRLNKNSEKLESRIESLKEEMKNHKINHPTNQPFQ
jgi:hypothetical protein